MSIIEQKKIVIRLPHLSWSFFLNIRVAIAIALLFCTALFAYWYHEVRPFLWVETAHVEAFSTPIYSDFSGKIFKMNPQEGDLIQKGEVLFVLNDESLFTKQKTLKLSIDSLNEQIVQQKVRMEKAMQEYLSAMNEVELGIGSEDEIQHHLTILEEAQTSNEKSVEDLKQLNSDLARLGLEANKLSFSSPFEGIVLKKARDEGAYVSVGEPVYLLSDPHRIWIEADVPETEISRIDLGTQVKVRLPAYPKKEWMGKVTWIGPATVSKIASRPFSGENEHVPVKISLENPDFSLKPGLSAHLGFKVR